MKEMLFQCMNEQRTEVISVYIIFLWVTYITNLANGTAKYIGVFARLISSAARFRCLFCSIQRITLGSRTLCTVIAFCHFDP